MSSTDRQNRLLVAEDWKRVYQSYRNADFKSYDFDNLRRTMINYLRENYPEDFNDYIESSEYLALIDLIAFLGQNFAFRSDLNARENFIELAERRESVLRLARLLSYNPKRNQSANGLLKIESVQTTESIRDSNNTNLSNQTVVWNDPGNSNWYEQFIKIMNSALPVNNTVGRPIKSETVNGVPTQQYRFNSTNADTPVFGFNKTIDGVSARFEIVSTDIQGSSIIEEAPFPGNNFAFLYRDDGRGFASSNSGFFCHFRQGALDEGTFNIDSPSTSQVVAIDSVNVNNTDVWLYKLNNFGAEEELWTKVDAVEGNNVIYNSLSKDIKNIYSVLTRANDRISLVFSDGTFGNLPQGQFRIYYRTSKNQRLIVDPKDMKGISIRIPYISKTGKQETLNLIFQLKYTVDNSTTSETSASIKANAPSTYYTQNRMVTAEDYQIGPLGVSQEIVKVKSVNRISSGISRFFDLKDATGKYSETNLFGKDGIVYKETLKPKQTFSFTTKTDVEGAIVNIIEPILADRKIQNFYYDAFPKILVNDLNVIWTSKTSDTNNSTGFFTSASGLKAELGSFTVSTLKLIRTGSLLKFNAPTGKYFDSANSNIVKNIPATGKIPAFGKTYLWTKVISVLGNGTEDAADGTGPVLFNDIIPSTSKLIQIIPRISNSLQNQVKTQLIDQTFAYKTFGLRFDTDIGEWRLITNNNLNTTANFSIGKTGDNTNQQLDASWLLLFETDGDKYTITYRASRYIFESDDEIRFYYDSTDKNFSTLTGKTKKDKISILEINPQPNSTESFSTNFDWEIVEEYRDAEGYVNSKKIQVSFFDSDDDGVVDDPDIFETIVDENVEPITKYIFLTKNLTSDGVEDFNYIPQKTKDFKVLSSKDTIGMLSQYNDGQVFYYIDEDIFEVLNKDAGTLTITQEYKARIGRDNLKFQYIHTVDSNVRIDPSVSNIIDTYLLTRSYDTSFRQYLEGTTTIQPLPPSSDQLYLNHGEAINKIKSLSDEVIYHPVKYKVLLGDKADTDLQGKIKIVKNTDAVLNDNDVKSRVIAAVNTFFALENWEFGETFYFSELSAYVMQQLAPDLVTFVIVPNQTTQSFGSLFEVKSETDEIFISGATVDDVDIIDAITASRLKASGTVVTSTQSVNVGIQSDTSY